MKTPRSLFAALCIVFLLPAADARSGAERFTARLSPMPVDFRNASAITGLGELTASLDGMRLELKGEFEGLRGPATFARLHHGPLAIPGPAIADLQVNRASNGEVSGTVLLTTEQLQALKDRALYVQIHSKAAPDGNLRGWLFPVATQ